MINKIERINKIEYHFNKKERQKKAFISRKKIQKEVKEKDFQKVLNIELSKIDIFI